MRIIIDIVAGLFASSAALYWTGSAPLAVASTGAVLCYGMWCWTDGMNTAESIWKKVL